MSVLGLDSGYTVKYTPPPSGEGVYLTVYPSSRPNRELTENIPNCVYFPQLGISNNRLGIIYPIGDWGYMSLVKQSQRTNHQSPIG